MTDDKRTPPRSDDSAGPGASELTGERPKRWWAERWGGVMESIGVARRIERGRRYARAERVMALEVANSQVTAEVQGSRFDPYRVELGIPAFTDEQWDEAVKALASQALFSAQLLAGDMPENIEDAFSKVGLSLFPSSSSELTMSCSCPDEVDPCKHVAAVHYQLAEKLDEDPFLLFAWRGRTKDRILRELRRRRAAEASGSSDSPSSSRSLRDSVPEFWTLGSQADEVAIAVGPPAVPTSLLKRLGPPPFWKSHPEIRGSLERLYAKVTERAMALAYGGRGIGESDKPAD